MTPGKITRASLAALLLALAGPAQVPRAHAEPPSSTGPVEVRARLKISDGYVRVPPPGQTNAVAFMTLSSADGKEHEIVSVSSTVAKTCALHTHTHQGGVMRMSEIPSLRVPAEGTVKLAPGGLHVMLLNVQRPIRAGDSISLTFKFRDGSSQELILVARTP